MHERKILVVDDDRIVCGMLEHFFSQSNYTVRTARNAEVALDILSREKIQVMFLDLNMPGMNGLDLCRIIRKEFPMSIIYALTGYDSLYRPLDCIEAGFNDYFKKPVDLGVLHKAAKDAFKKNREMQRIAEE